MAAYHICREHQDIAAEITCSENQATANRRISRANTLPARAICILPKANSGRIITHLIVGIAVAASSIRRCGRRDRRHMHTGQHRYMGALWALMLSEYSRGRRQWNRCILARAASRRDGR